MRSTRERRFEELLAEGGPRLAAIARSYASGDEAADLLQEILLQIWRGLEGFAGRSALGTWAYRVALNTAISFRSERWSRARRPFQIPPSGAPSTPAAPRREIAILEEFIAGLGPTDRAVFVLYLEDLSYREIAEVVGLTESHVGVKIHRLKGRFIERYL